MQKLQNGNNIWKHNIFKNHYSHTANAREKKENMEEVSYRYAA